ncbi:MAG: flagellar basal-body rod protein FlgF [Deltaproteobacteria bacterium]|nr:flagellar basal-body rod protein FlgF [Deltaproteobacteria bacterium]
MSGTIYIAASGAIAQERMLNVVSNNLANINTAGFKEDKTFFRSYLPGSFSSFKGNPQNNEIAIKNGMPPDSRQGNIHVKFEGASTNFSPGQLKYTGDPLDFALGGKGFFTIRTNDGIQYTRKGDFTLNQDGVLVTQDGFPVLGEGGEIQINMTDGEKIIVDLNGNISLDEKQIDSLRIVEFDDPHLLNKVGNTLFATENPKDVGKKANEIDLNQGYIESSNVDSIKAMTEIIEALRGFESYQKILQSIDKINSKTNNEVGKLI